MEAQALFFQECLHHPTPSLPPQLGNPDGYETPGRLDRLIASLDLMRDVRRHFSSKGQSHTLTSVEKRCCHHADY